MADIVNARDLRSGNTFIYKNNLIVYNIEKYRWRDQYLWK